MKKQLLTNKNKNKMKKQLLITIFAIILFASCTNSGDKFLGTWTSTESGGNTTSILTITKSGDDYLVDYKNVLNLSGFGFSDGSFKEVGKLNGNSLEISDKKKVSLINNGERILMDNKEFVKQQPMVVETKPELSKEAQKEKDKEAALAAENAEKDAAEAVKNQQIAGDANAPIPTTSGQQQSNETNNTTETKYKFLSGNSLKFFGEWKGISKNSKGQRIKISNDESCEYITPSATYKGKAQMLDNASTNNDIEYLLKNIEKGLNNIGMVANGKIKLYDKYLCLTLTIDTIDNKPSKINSALFSYNSQLYFWDYSDDNYFEFVK